MTIIAVDIGNTSAKIGLFEGDELAETAALPLTGPQLTLPPQFVRAAEGKKPTLVLSTVNPAAAEAMGHKLCSFFDAKLIRIRRDIDIPVRCLTQQPSQTGTDRLVNAFATYQITGAAAIIIDAGTAITVDAINDSGDFLGGAIAAGMGSSARALHEFTSRLPLISPHSPVDCIPRNTHDAINFGLVVGLAGLIDRLVENSAGQLNTKPVVVATGGDINLLAPHITCIDRVEEHLSLTGIKLIYENRR